MHFTVPSKAFLSVKPLQTSDIPFLQQTDCLYSFDPRPLLDTCIGKHRYIVSFENSLCRSLSDKPIAVNQYALRHTAPERNRLWILPMDGDPRPSLYQRMLQQSCPTGIQSLWVAVPSRDAERWADAHSLRINYRFDDYLRYNDKIAQKEALGDLSPTWERIDPKTHAFDSREACYFKRAHGAGGYATFHASDLDGAQWPSRKHPATWYKETAVEGTPVSVQLLRDAMGRYCLFGYSEMKIIQKKQYAGALLKPVTGLPGWMIDKIRIVLKQMDGLLCGYHGFFGLDLMVKNANFWVLEANVRVTMATFAALELNERQLDALEFYRYP